MKTAESRRQGAYPVLKRGKKWPCVTMYSPPGEEPVCELSGEVASASASLQSHVDAALAEHAAAEEIPVATIGALPLPCGSDAVKRLTVLQSSFFDVEWFGP